MGKFFDDIKAGLEEAIDFEKGKTTLRTRTVELPARPEQYASKDVKRIREENYLSQSIFAMWMNVSVKTVRSWESGERTPSHAALRLLELIDKGIYRPEMQRRSA